MCVIKNKHKGSKLSPGFPTSSSTDCGVDQGLRRGCGETIKDRKAVRERKIEGGRLRRIEKHKMSRVAQRTESSLGCCWRRDCRRSARVAPEDIAGSAGV